MSQYFLRFADQNEAATSFAAAGMELPTMYGLGFMLTDGTPCENHTPGAIRWDADVLGQDPVEDGNVHPGFHVNLLIDAPLHTALTPYQIDVVTPMREFG